MNGRPFPDGMERQIAIYMAGLEGRRPSVPCGYEDLRESARQAMTPEAFDYLDGGAGGGDTMRENLAAFRRRRIVPRHLRGVAERDLSVELLGRRLPAPLLLAPIGVQGIFHPDGETAVARAAGPLGIPLVLSTVSYRPLEEVAAAAGAGPRWFQLYWPRDPELAESLLGRAAAAGYEAVVLTLDLPLLAWRERDIRHAYLPFLRGDGLANYFTDPVFRKGLPDPVSDPRPAIEKFGQVFANPSLGWKDLEWLRGRIGVPLVVKGVLAPDDARRAVDHGADAVVVSNHGGRQVDGSIAALDALPGVAAAVDGGVPVLFDSGIRRGADAVIALALGARAVLLGRPYACALAAGGEDGVREFLLDFLADLDVTLALSGCRTPAEAVPELLFDSPAAG